MAEVHLENLHKTYGGVIAVKDLSLHIADHEFVVLVGPSGCGKSTTLRMIAGLEDITGGTIAIGDRIVNRDDADIGPREPSGQMASRCDLAEPGDCSAEFHIQARAISSSSR